MKTKKQYRQILEARLDEVLDDKFDQRLALTMAKYSEEQMENHLKLLKNMGVPSNDPRALKTQQQINNRQSIQKRLKARPE